MALYLLLYISCEKMQRVCWHGFLWAHREESFFHSIYISYKAVFKAVLVNFHEILKFCFWWLIFVCISRTFSQKKAAIEREYAQVSVGLSPCPRNTFAWLRSDLLSRRTLESFLLLAHLWLSSFGSLNFFFDRVLCIALTVLEFYRLALNLEIYLPLSPQMLGVKVYHHPAIHSFLKDKLWPCYPDWY